MTGKYTGTAMPSMSGVIYESPNSSAFFYTTDQAFPKDGDIEIYTTNYYDSHDFDGDGTDEINYQSTNDYTDTTYPYVRGKATGSKVAVLPEDENAAPTIYLDSYLFYDKFSRVVQTQSDHHLRGRDVVWNDYNFVGWLLKTKREHAAVVEGENKSVTIRERYIYDHIGRLKNTYHQINNEAEQLICEKVYNERDELSLKRLGVNPSTDGALQNVNYSYNIRKWLTAINDLDNLGNDLFAMNLKYTENIANNFNNAVNYNGNITAIEWRHSTEANSRIYSYEYDDLNRLTTAVYGERNGATNLNKNRYNSAYTYDANGNILTLERNGFRAGSYGRIDDMLYNYTADGRLEQIEETSERGIGFKSAAANGIAQYQYDANGNMTQDDHKEIVVEYNYLNLPTKVEKGEQRGDFVAVRCDRAEVVEGSVAR